MGVPLPGPYEPLLLLECSESSPNPYPLPTPPTSILGSHRHCWVSGLKVGTQRREAPPGNLWRQCWENQVPEGAATHTRCPAGR